MSASMLPDDWEVRSFDKFFEQKRVGKRLQSLPKSEWKDCGVLPVIGQGQGYAEGRTDRRDLTCPNDLLPLIIFGPHTRAVKAVEEPFVSGPNVRYLWPAPDVDFDYAAFALEAAPIQSRGYNDHFPLVKELTFARPSLPEQQAIASILKRTRKLRDLQEAALISSEELKRATMRQVFTQGLEGEEQCETEIGPLPISWAAARLDEHARVISTRMGYSELELTDASDAKDAVTVLGIKVADMNRPGNETELKSAALAKLVQRSTAEHRCAPPGTIIFPKRGAAIATNKKRLSKEWVAFDPNVIGVVAGESLDREFLFYWFQTFDLRSITEPGPTPQLNKKNVEPLIIPVPPTVREQREIAAAIRQIDRKIDLHRSRRDILQGLFDVLLQQLTSGELRISEFAAANSATERTSEVAVV